jgi:hypothetical protein
MMTRFASTPRISAAWPIAGDGLRRDSGESAELPTGVKEVLTLLVNAKTCGKAGVQRTVGSQSGRDYASGATHTPGVGDYLLRINQQSRFWPCLWQDAALKVRATQAVLRIKETARLLVGEGGVWPRPLPTITIRSFPPEGPPFPAPTFVDAASGAQAGSSSARQTFDLLEGSGDET